VGDLHFLFAQLSLSGLHLVNHHTLETLVPHVGLVSYFTRIAIVNIWIPPGYFERHSVR